MRHLVYFVLFCVLVAIVMMQYQPDGPECQVRFDAQLIECHPGGDR